MDLASRAEPCFRGIGSRGQQCAEISGRHPHAAPAFRVSEGCSISLSAGVPIGGWKIATILSGKSSRIESIHSLSSQLAAGVVLAGANLLGGVLSPNQLVKASVLGTGAGGRKGTPWRILANNLIMGWFIHLPACALIAAAIHWCASRALGLGMGSLETIMGVLGP